MSTSKFWHFAKMKNQDLSCVPINCLHQDQELVLIIKVVLIFLFSFNLRPATGFINFCKMLPYSYVQRTLNIVSLHKVGWECLCRCALSNIFLPVRRREHNHSTAEREREREREREISSGRGVHRKNSSTLPSWQLTICMSPQFTFKQNLSEPSVRQRELIQCVPATWHLSCLSVESCETHCASCHISKFQSFADKKEEKEYRITFFFTTMALQAVLV